MSALSLSLVLLAGCGVNSSTSITGNPGPPSFSGGVKVGSLPVAGASVTIFVAGATGNGSAPIALLGAPLTTDADGAFTLPSNLICPSAKSPLLYAVATGGTAGTGGNAGITLAAVLGVCNSIPAAASFTIDEATTVATAYAMAQFISGEDIGGPAPTATNSSGLVLAAATAASLVDPTTGTAPGANFPATGIAPIPKLNSLANLLNACAISSAASAPCTDLYSASSTAGSTPTDIFAAAINIVKQPGTNVSALYTLSHASSAYAPALSTVPADWTLAVNYNGGGMNGPSVVSIDSAGQIWVANYYSVASLFTNTGTPVFPSGIVGDQLFESFGGAVDGNDHFWIANEESNGPLNNGLGSISVLNDTGGLNGNYIAGGINFPLAVAFDTCGDSWVVDYGNSHVTLLDPTGNPLSGTSGYSAANLVFPVAVATDAKCNAYVANQSSNTLTRVLADGSAFTDFAVGDGPSGVAIDASGNIWSANYYGDSVGLVSSSGTVLSGTAGYTGGGLDHPQGIAIDGSGTAWVVNYRGPALSELAGASTTTPGAILSPAAGWAPDSSLAEAFGLAIDASGNLWATSFATNTLTEFVGLATPVQTPALGPVRVP